MQHKSAYSLIFLVSLLTIVFLTSPNQVYPQWPTDDEEERRPGPRISAGLRGGFDTNVKALSLGGQFRFPLPFGFGRGGIQIIPSGDVFFRKSDPDWQLNLDAAIPLLFFYGGLGLAYTNRNFYQPDEKKEKTGVNYFIGLPIPLRSPPVLLFIEGRWTNVDDESLFRLNIGLNVFFGGGGR
jgi:hypothetical protein